MDPYVDLKNQYEAKNSLEDAAQSGTTAANGSAVDCDSYRGPIHAVANVGAVTGTPDSFIVTVKLQESDTSGGTYTDLETQSTGVISAAAGCVMVRGIRTKRYVRAVATPAFVGGTSPATTVSANVLGRKASF